MSACQPINPYFGSGQTVVPAVASASVAVSATAKQLCFTNTGAAICYVRVYEGTLQVATVADMPILPNSQRVITKGEGPNNVAYISATGTTLNIMPCEGF